MDKNFFPSVIASLIFLVSLINFVLIENWEFVFYVFVAIGFYYLVIRSDNVFGYPRIAIWGLTAWVAMHMAGGAIYLRGVRLYDVMMFSLIGEPYNILKYDQFVHFYIYLIIGVLVWSIFKKYSKEESILRTALIIFAVLGIGSFYELIEFSTVVMFAHTGVGGYYNLVLDILFDFIGAVFGVLIGKSISGRS